MKDDPRLSRKSDVSSMRWAFMATIKAVLLLTVLTVVASIVLAFMGKSVDILGISALLSPITAFAFSGKAAQTKFEKTEAPTDTKDTN